MKHNDCFLVGKHLPGMLSALVAWCVTHSPRNSENLDLIGQIHSGSDNYLQVDSLSLGPSMSSWLKDIRDIDKWSLLKSL